MRSIDRCGVMRLPTPPPLENSRESERVGQTYDSFDYRRWIADSAKGRFYAEFTRCNARRALESKSKRMDGLQTRHASSSRYNGVPDFSSKSIALTQKLSVPQCHFRS